MITLSNLLKDSMIRLGSDIISDRTNLFTMGNVGVVQGQYYFVAFAIQVRTQALPYLMSFTFGEGLSLVKLAGETLKTSNVISKYQTTYNTLGVYLYGGYCTKSNPSWWSQLYYGANYFSSFSYSIDEVQGASTDPIVQTITSPTNVGVLENFTPGNSTYLMGTSMIPREEFPMVLSSDWKVLSNGFAENVVPNIMTAYRTPGEADLAWHNIDGFGREVPYLDRTLIACELEAS